MVVMKSAKTAAFYSATTTTFLFCWCMYYLNKYSIEHPEQFDFYFEKSKKIFGAFMFAFVVFVGSFIVFFDFRKHKEENNQNNNL